MPASSFDDGGESKTYPDRSLADARTDQPSQLRTLYSRPKADPARRGFFVCSVDVDDFLLGDWAGGLYGGRRRARERGRFRTRGREGDEFWMSQEGVDLVQVKAGRLGGGRHG